MHGIKSTEGRWSVSLCNCSEDTAHFHYGNVVLHIALDDLRDLGARDAERRRWDRTTGSQRFYFIQERFGPVVMTHVVAIIIKGGIVMIPLVACSLISLALTIERIMFWAKLKSKDVLSKSYRWSKTANSSKR